MSNNLIGAEHNLYKLGRINELVQEAIEGLKRVQKEATEISKELKELSINYINKEGSFE